VVCDPAEFVDDQLDTLTNPQLIGEVLSDSTEKYDRGAKFERSEGLTIVAKRPPETTHAAMSVSTR
jgi:hypothetical protein